MKKHTVIFGSCIFALSVLFCGCSGESKSLADLLKLGTDSAEAGKWENAEKYARRAVRLAPADPDALTLYALALERKGDLNGAIEQISKVASRKDASWFILYTKGRLLYERGDYESCIASLDAAHRMRPESPDPLILLAQASVKLNNSIQAMTYYSRLLKDKKYLKDPAPWSEIGMNKYLVEKRPKEAYQYFYYAYSVGRQSNPSTILNMAVFCDSALRNKRLAERYYREYLKAAEGNSALSGKCADVRARLKLLR